MRAFNDLGGAIVAPNSLHQPLVGFAGAFGNKDIAGAP